MKTDPADLGKRYLPFLIVAAVLALLVTLTPSRGSNDNTSALNTGGVTSGQVATNGANGANGAGGTVGTNGAAGTSTLGSTGGGGSSGGAGTSSRGGTALGAASNASAGNTNGKPDLSNCMPDGSQKPGRKVYFYMVPCVPVWHGGHDNGGKTMDGVSSTEIRYTFYRTQQNAAVNALLNQAGNYAESADQICTSFNAFQKEAEKIYETYGRKLVPVDGPGSNAGSKQVSNGNKCNYPYYQSTCSLTPPDKACDRADGDTLASMHVAFVLAPIADNVMYDELAKKRVVTLGLAGFPRSYYQKWAPYVWDTGYDGEFAADMTVEYYCKRLAGQKAVYGGPDVQRLPYGNRHLGIAFPENNGDPSTKIVVDKVVAGVKKCGENAKEYAYSSDITTAEQQSQTIAASMQSDHVTTIACFCDPIAPAFFQEAAKQDNYYPEYLLSGWGLLDSDPAGQTYEELAPGEWDHAFGLGYLPNLQPDKNYDYHYAYKDGGGTGDASPTDVGNWPLFQWMFGAVQMAGPTLTPNTIMQGQLAIPAMGGSFEKEFPEAAVLSYGQVRTNVDPLGWLGRDMREIWYDPQITSKYNNTKGGYCATDGGRRKQLGQWPTTRPHLFDPKVCAT